MKTLCLCCILSVPQLVYAAAPQGYIVQWGWNTAFGVASPPTMVLSNAVAVAAGSGQSLALRPDGTVWGWGGNSVGEATGDATTSYPYLSTGQVSIAGQVVSNVTSIVAARGFSLALKRDGTVVTWGRNYVPSGLTNIVAIAAGWGESWVLKSDGTVAGWKSDPPLHGHGQLIPVGHLSNVVAIAVGPCFSGTRGVALMRDGTVGHWGSESIYMDATPPAGLSNVVAIAAGANHSLALKRDGTVVGWGFNSLGQATGARTTNAPNIAAGPVSIGGQVLSNAASIAAGSGYSLALRKDGTVIAWGRTISDLYPATVPDGLSNVVGIAVGAADSFLAITTNAQVAARFLQKK